MMLFCATAFQKGVVHMSEVVLKTVAVASILYVSLVASKTHAYVFSKSNPPPVTWIAVPPEAKPLETLMRLQDSEYLNAASLTRTVLLPEDSVNSTVAFGSDALYIHAELVHVNMVVFT